MQSTIRGINWATPKGYGEKSAWNQCPIYDSTDKLDKNATKQQEKIDNFDLVQQEHGNKINQNLQFIDENSIAIDTLDETIDLLQLSPIGSIVAWVPRVDSGDPNENLPNGWIRCDGGVIPNPSIWEGCHTLDLNGKQKFLRGGQDASVLDMEDDMVQGDTLLFDFVQS